MSSKAPYNNSDLLQIPPDGGNSSQIGFTAPPAPPSYDQATGSAATVTGHVAGQPTENPNQSQNYHQQYISSSTCVYTPAQTVPPPTQTTIYTQQPVVFVQQQALPLGPEPVYITCPNCHVQKLTRIEYEPSSRTHLMAALLCILGLWCCVCLPYCAGSCMNANHYCGNCNKFLGAYGSSL